MKNLEKLTKYTEEIQKEIIETLKCYDKCHVERIGTEYKVCVGYCLKDSYGDEEVLDEFTKDEIFTVEDQIINYMESFHEYHPLYKGKRNYRMINEIGNDWSYKFKFDNEGNIVIA